MLELKNSNIKKQFIEINQRKEYDNVYREILLVKMRDGEWDDIEQTEVIFMPNGENIKFEQDCWPVKSLGGETTMNIFFALNGKKLERNITNEIKACALALIFTGRDRCALKTIEETIRQLNKIAHEMLKYGLNTFSKLNDNNLKKLVQANPNLFPSSERTSHFNRLIAYHEDLPFKINFSRQTEKSLGVTYRKKKQHLVIPPRFYTELVNTFSMDVKSALPHILQIESETERMINIEQKFRTYILNQFRKGSISPSNLFNDHRYKKITKRFEQEGIPIIDNLESEEQHPNRWMELMNEMQGNIRMDVTDYSKSKKSWSFKPFIIGQQTFDTIGKFKSHLQELNMKCQVLCLLLSGMRIDELHSMHPDYAAQSYKYQGQKIHLFTTRQSKITKGVQTKEDTFVTSQTGHDAYRVLTALNRNFLKRDVIKVSYFVSFTQTQNIFSLTKQVWGNRLRKDVNNWIGKYMDNTITQEDMSFLRVSNPSSTNIEEGIPYHFTLHQTRRSFAFYVIGLELMAFPQLKQQLSHVSSAMTRHYANNATYWGALRNEIQSERNLQKSTILANVYQRIANKERIAGGKGKALNSIAGNSNFFEKNDNSRMLDPDYWANLIKIGKSHIHAIAPGMYCTNAQCDMRINVAIEECVNCEFDIIMEGMYAEGKRINASKNLALLDELNELTHSVASQLVMQIRSCEAILMDLDMPFDPVKLPKTVTKLLIKTTTI